MCLTTGTCYGLERIPVLLHWHLIQDHADKQSSQKHKDLVTSLHIAWMISVVLCVNVGFELKVAAPSPETKLHSSQVHIRGTSIFARRNKMKPKCTRARKDVKRNLNQDLNPPLSDK